MIGLIITSGAPVFDIQSLRDEIARTDALLEKVRWALPAGSMRRHEPIDCKVIEGNHRIVEPKKLNVIQP
jgi:hypothetical protein